jgi:hypothetical protein
MSSMAWMSSRLVISSRLVVLPHRSHARRGARLLGQSALLRCGYLELLSHSTLWQHTLAGHESALCWRSPAIRLPTRLTSI